jgi:polysaccharide pyruvyl transferase WcaK-like protein
VALPKSAAQNNTDKTVAARTVNILLYALIPEDRAYAPIVRGPWAAFRTRMRRLLDLMQWRLAKKWRAHYSTFEDSTGSNQGDIAIRMGVRQQLTAAFAGRDIAFTEVPWGELGTALRTRRRFDLIVIAGGGFLFADATGRLPKRLAADVRAMGSAACPIAAVSIGINFLISTGAARSFAVVDDQRVLIRRFIFHIALLSVRDSATQSALTLSDGAAPPVIVDPAFLLGAPQERAAEAAPGSDAAPPRPRSGEGPALAIGLNLAFHGHHTSALSARILPRVVGVLTALQRETPCRFFYFVHSDGERGIAAALRIAGIKLEMVDGDVEALCAGYRRLDVHMGQMLHSAILAMGAGTPTLALAYDMKSAGFFDLFGLRALCLDAVETNETALLSALRALIADRHAIARVIAAQRAPLASASGAFYAGIAALAPRGLMKAAR